MINSSNLSIRSTHPAKMTSPTNKTPSFLPQAKESKKEKLQREDNFLNWLLKQVNEALTNPLITTISNWEESFDQSNLKRLLSPLSGVISMATSILSDPHKVIQASKACENPILATIATGIKEKVYLLHNIDAVGPNCVALHGLGDIALPIHLDLGKAIETKLTSLPSLEAIIADEDVEIEDGEDHEVYISNSIFIPPDLSTFLLTNLVDRSSTSILSQTIEFVKIKDEKDDITTLIAADNDEDDAKGKEMRKDEEEDTKSH